MIKKFLIICTVAITLVACDNKKENEPQEKSEKSSNTEGEEAPKDENVGNGKFAKFEFDKTELDFGTVKEGEIVSESFKFKNVGDVPLVISDAKGSCGCTVPEKPTDPIKVDGSDEIAFKFDSNGRVGNVSKTITLTANTSPEKTVLNIKGVVIAKEKPKDEKEEGKEG